MDKDGITMEEATREVELCKEDLHDRISIGESPYDILEEWFGLEPDWILDLLD